LINYYGFKVKVNTIEKKEKLIDEKKFNLILHPKSRGSAREWPEDRYNRLIDLLPKEKFKIFVTGTVEEGVLLKQFLEKNTTKVTDLTGKFKLNEFINFINQCDGLVAASTGPLHIAAAMGKLVVGIFPPIKPMHPGRWAPLGKNAHFVVVDKKCNDCRKSLNCRCIGEITPEQIKNKLLENA
jgi:heptosyltransferase III